MELKNHRAAVFGLLVFIGAANSLWSQTAAPHGNSSAQATDKAVVLSPFVVNSDKDTGYQATSTLAGTRLNTPVKDLGAAISIYTKDFINDIGATSTNDLLVFATGMEASGSSGNFADIGSDISAERPSANGARIDPQASSRSRGLSSPTFTRDYFTTSISTDSYNTGTLTVNRGPNAALFGVGSAAGVVDTALLKADVQRDKNSVSVRYGNNGALRESIDLNRVLIPKMLALRIDGLHDDEEYNQRPAYEKKRRIYAALTFQPYRSTALRANFEAGNTRANRPIGLTPYESASTYWLNGGRPSYDWKFYDDPVLNPSTATASHNTSTEGFLMGTGSLGSQPIVVYSNPTDQHPSFGFLGRTPSTSSNVPNAVLSSVYNPIVNRNLLSDDIQFVHTLNIFEMPAGFWTGANVLPGQQSGFVPAGLKAQGFTDYSAFDFRNRMIDETSHQGDNFHTFNVTFDQSAWQDRIGIELAYNKQRIDRRSKNSFFSVDNSDHIYIDTSVTLPTGQPNPNLGRPFAVYGQSNWIDKFEDRDAKHATGYLKYDFKDLNDSWGKWLGRHTFTGIYEDSAVNQINYKVATAVEGTAAQLNTTSGLNTQGRRPALLVYMGPSVIGNNNPVTLNPIQISEISAGPTAPITYFSRAADLTDPGHFETAPASLAEIAGSGSASREVIRSQAAVLQSYWLQELLITTLSWRRDQDYFISKSIGFVANPNDRNDPGKSRFGFNDFAIFGGTPPLNVSKEIKSGGAVLRWPQQLVRLPAGVDLSVFCNNSQNFTPSGGRITPFGEPIASPQGKTKEYGFNFSAFNDRFTVRVNWFETSIAGASSSPNNFTVLTVSSVLQAAQAWAVEGNTNPQLAAQRNADIELMFNALPANYRSLYQFQINGTAPNISVSGNLQSGLSGSTDTRDSVAKGTELDLVFNPTRHWRILANLAKQQTVLSNSFPFSKRFVALMKPVWDQLGNTPRSNYPAGYVPGTPLPANTQTLSQWLDVNVYVPLTTALATDGSASAEQRKWRSNLVANYTFGSDSIFGRTLKGFGVGTGIRWQSKLGIGYPATRNADSSVHIDTQHPYYAPADTNVDAWVSYEHLMWQNRINWKLQLNLRNLIGTTALIPVTAQPWGAVATARIPPEHRWYLTSTFEF
jgi:hypothetical protein